MSATDTAFAGVTEAAARALERLQGEDKFDPRLSAHIVTAIA